MTYYYTTEQINTMTLEELNANIEKIDRDPEMFEAEMADRLYGTEKEMYEQNKRMWFALVARRNELRANTKEYWYEVINKRTEEIAIWNNRLEIETSALAKYNLKQSIADAEKTIQKANNRLAELSK